LIVGIDPGVTGALAWFDDTGELIEVHDMPTVKVGTKTRVSAALLAAMFPVQPKLVIVERVHSMPGNGSASSFTFGYSAGLIEGICAARQFSVRFVEPATWKRVLGLTNDKGASRMMAQRLWPFHAKRFALVKHADRAEACLIGYCGIQNRGKDKTA